MLGKKLPKIGKNNILLISTAILLVFTSLITPSHILAFKIIGVPPLIHFLLLLSLFQSTIAIIMVLEVKKVSGSPIWDNLYVANLLGVVHPLVLAILLNENYAVLSIYTIVLIVLFYTFAVFMVNITIYLIIKPILKRKINFVERENIFILFLLPIIIWYLFLRFTPFINFPYCQHTTIFYAFLFFYFFIILYFISYFIQLSKSYAKLGFVNKAALTTTLGGFFTLLYFILIFAKINFNLSYYYLSSLFICVTFAVIYYFRFGIEYPSLLNPKWKTYMPFDIVKVTAAATLAFLALSLFFTVMEHGNVHFINLLKNIPHPFFFLLLLPFSAIILILTPTKALSSKTKLKYWTYMRYGLYIHLLATFYVLCLAFLQWESSNSVDKLIFSAVFVLSFAFYLLYALDLRKICKDVEIKSAFNKIDIARHVTSLYSVFFLILLSISFAYKKDITIFDAINLESYPFFIFFCLSFIIAFVAYLNVPHKGFEELMPKNIWTGLSYVTNFAIFILVYIIFVFNADMRDFPLRDLFFIAYFAVLIIEIAAVKSLIREREVVKEEMEELKMRKAKIGDILNSYASKFFRVDYLEDLWKKTVDRYVPEDELPKIGFVPSRRRFDLEKVDEPTRITIAVGILLEMLRLPNMKRTTILKKSIETEGMKAEISEILKEKILMLPEELRSQFDEDMYYPILFERMVNNLIIHLEAFIPLSEQEKIFEGLKWRAEEFECFGFDFEHDEIRIKHGTRLSRCEFLELFRFYLESLEEKFPFRRFLLYELIREEIKEGLAPYGITISELLDVVPTGVEKMDEVTAGGLAKRTSALLITEETKTKHKIMLSFIKQVLKEEYNVIYATSKRSYPQIRDELLIDFKELKNCVIIDFYESIYTENRVYKLIEEDNRLIAPVNMILFQRSIVKTIKSYPKEEPKIVVIDVYDDLSRYYSSDEVFELLQKQIDGFKRWNCTCLITINPNSYLITSVGEEVLKKNFDNVMILSGDDKDASVFIERLYHGTPSRQIISL